MPRPYRQLTLEERRALFRLLNAKVPVAEIAGRATVTLADAETTASSVPPEVINRRVQDRGKRADESELTANELDL